MTKSITITIAITITNTIDHHHHQLIINQSIIITTIIISIFRLGCFPCPIWWGWCFQINTRQATSDDIILHTFGPCLSWPSSIWHQHVCDGFDTGHGMLLLYIPSPSNCEGLPWSGGSRSPIYASSSNLVSSPNLVSLMFLERCIWTMMWLIFKVLSYHKAARLLDFCDKMAGFPLLVTKFGELQNKALLKSFDKYTCTMMSILLFTFYIAKFGEIWWNSTW